MENRHVKRSTRTRALFKVGAILGLALLVLGGVRLWQGEPATGGAVLNFTSTIPAKRIEISSARDQAGRPFAHAGSFHHSDKPMKGGATMGSAPDTFGLPTWIEFKWQELLYPAQPRELFATEEAWNAYVNERYCAAPLKIARVTVAEKVPAWALEEVAKSRATTPPDQLPDKMLWLHFIWTTEGIKMRWKIHNSERGGNSPEGGDPI
ncbi:hypothetical protein MasN3_01240 [Massilia varians]|uniref:Uncharacterized protein n=1 Tax=Massilia varians TaxID=457921 RepID=A0ABN6T6B5_9BURK|nr:hypothetical protein [Massilia varians]BDT56630.1 hypothetical protein MasN3_01240 [Massilia varians]